MLSIAKLREAFSFRHFLTGVAVAALAALALRAFSGLPFWACFLMATAAMLVSGWLATWEDNQPGGPNDQTADHHSDSKANRPEPRKTS
jgi:hypothetical protein